MRKLDSTKKPQKVSKGREKKLEYYDEFFIFVRIEHEIEMWYSHVDFATITFCSQLLLFLSCQCIFSPIFCEVLIHNWIAKKA